MRILHVCPYSDAAYGGPVSTLVGLAKAQRAAGDAVSVATMTHRSGRNSVIPDLQHDDINVTTYGEGRGPLRSLHAVRDVADAVRSSDVVHVHGVWEDIIAAALYAADAHDIPAVLRPCGMLTEWSITRHAMRKRVLWRMRARGSAALASAIHFASAQEQEQTIGLPMDGQQQFVEPNGISAADFTGGDGVAFRRAHDIGIDSTLILFLSRIHPGKGLEALIDAFVTATTDEILVIAGPADAAYLSSIRRRAGAAGAAGRVLFTGMISRAARRDALAAASFFVLPSEHESFGNAALEALAAGRQVLISSRVPLADVITEQDCGVVCEPEATSIAQALHTMLRMRTDIMRQEESAIARACASRFDWQVVAARLRARYAALSDGRRG